MIYSSTNETHIVVLCGLNLLPVVHDHAVGAVWGARAAPIPDEVLGAGLNPAPIRLVAVVAMVFDTAAEVVAHGQAASFNPSL